MVQAFRANGLGQILDFVPNHMGVGGADNPLVARRAGVGPGFRLCRLVRHRLGSRPALPAEQAAGAVPRRPVRRRAQSRRLRAQVRRRRRARFAVWAYDTHKLPICPLHYDRVLGNEHPELERLGDCFSDLPIWRPQVARARARRCKAELASLVRDRHAPAATAAGSAQRQPALNDDWQALDMLIQEQHWRVAYFRVAADDINYRRFFNINDLAGLRMELPAVFRPCPCPLISD